MDKDFIETPSEITEIRREISAMHFNLAHIAALTLTFGGISKLSMLPIHKLVLVTLR
jgi:hypothetical protein